MLDEAVRLTVDIIGTIVLYGEGEIPVALLRPL